jgi:serine phosphatase RsbU (regulator of sigma subunit)
MFITAVLGRIKPRQGLIEFAVAGHSPPLIRHADLTITAPEIEAAPPLGIARDLVFSVNRISLLPGYQAIFYTDGLVESFNASHEPVSMDRVKAVLAQPLDGAEGIVAALTQLEAEHRGEMPPHDDMTILAVGLK